mgnify:CR=1 FL=1
MVESLVITPHHLDVVPESHEEPRVSGFNAPHTFCLGDIAADIAREMVDPDQALDNEQLVVLVRTVGNTAAVRFFEMVGSGEIDLITGQQGEVVRFTADAKGSIILQDSISWGWLRNDIKA